MGYRINMNIKALHSRSNKDVVKGRRLMNKKTNVLQGLIWYGSLFYLACVSINEPSSSLNIIEQGALVTITCQIMIRQLAVVVSKLHLQITQ